MTELLSREREFLKLNEELNKLAIAHNNTTSNNTFDRQQQQKHLNHNHNHQQQQLHLQKQQQQQHQHQHQHQQQSNTMASNRNGQEQRFYTYTKGKGPSTLLKKRGAGDCVSDAIVEAPLTARQQQSSRNSSRGMSGAATPNTARHVRARGGGGGAGGGCNEDETTAVTATATSVATTMTIHANTAPSTQRRSVRSPEASTRGYTSRTSTRAALTSSNATNTFTIKYRNSKFVESPSLEVLIKDESATLRRQSTTRLSISGGSEGGGAALCGPGDAESVTSVAGSEAASSGGTMVRRSQLACMGSTTKKPLSTEGLIKFLKSKITILEEDHDRISLEMNKQKELMEKTLERHKKVEQQRDQAYGKHNALTEQLAKVEAQLNEANTRFKERVAEQCGQQKDLEAVRRELKVLTQTNSNLEKRLYRANEELENTKNALTLVKNSERELKEAARIECDGKDKQIKSLKKQRADLLNAYKKQLFLIDNLKRQNICIEQSKLIGFGEREFTKVLEWNTKS